VELTGWAWLHRRSILFVLTIAVLGGIFAGLNLPIALFPNVEFPRIEVNLDAGDRPAAVMVVEVTRYVEEAVRSVPGVSLVRSTTSRGSAELSVNFNWGTDMNVALGQVESEMTRILPDLPQGSRFSARTMNPTVFPVAAYSLFSSNVDPITLRNIAQYQLLPLLSAVPGVASVTVDGGDIPEFRVSAQPGLLASYGVTMQGLTAALAKNNVLRVVGRIEDRHELLLALAQSRLQSPAAIGNTVIRSNPNGAVLVSDVAKVAEAPQPNYTIVTADGRPAVLLNVFQQPDGNTVEIVRGVAAALQSYRPKLPGGVTIRNWYDQSQLILESAASVRNAILIGVGLAALVLFAFLRSIRVTAIVLIIVPAVLAVTVLVLFVTGMSFNIMTLGGMAAAIGLIIDDAIVMVEQIERRLAGTTTDRRAIIDRAATDFFAPLAGSSSATVIIFLPLAFLSGVTGAFFKALSLTMASALIISFVATCLVIPLMAERLITARMAQAELDGPLYRRTISAYRRSYAAAQEHPWFTGAVMLVLVAIGVFAWLNTGSGFMPAMDEGGFILDYVSPPGTSLTGTNRMIQQVEQILRSVPEVDTWSRRTGLQLGGGLTEANTGDFFIRLKPSPRRPIEEVMADVEHRVEQNVSGLNIETAQLMEDLIGDLTSVPEPVEVRLFGDDAQQLRAAAENIAHRISSVPGITEVKNGIVVAGSNVGIDINPSLAGMEGLTPADIADQAETYISGTVATQVEQPQRVMGVRVWLPREDRGTIEDLARLPISAPDGHEVPLSRVAALRISAGEPEITRENLKLMVPVTARIEGRDMGSTVADVKRAVDSSGIITGTMYYTLGGLYEQQQSAFFGLLVVIVAAFLLVFALLLFLYERFDFAIAIILMPLLAMPAVFIGLWVTGTELNITALMGTTMVVGIVTEVAIFYFSEYQTLLVDGMASEGARLQAGVNRFRPIAMTTLAAILALLPLALPLGRGGQMQRPLAIAIISGLTVQMPLVLIIMPLVVARLGRLRAQREET
jgi:CzcA family heavy metal efflux pump